ncbi:MAG TPA: PAS domain S-box protein [Pyrinomonadaceae bacterium]|nr:PAS domain S-box protein [Pyrinomonadaceae bacterium]
MYDNVLKVLVVDDDEDDYVLIRELLAEIGPDGFDTTWAATYGDALRAIESNGPDVCLIDYRLGEYNGVELLREARARGLKLPAILLTAQDDYDVDLKAMRAGAADYLIKGQIDKQLLERSIRYAVEHARTLEALRTSENKYRQIIETAREGVWTVDPDACTTYVNQRMAEMLGYTVEEMLGRPTVAFMDADDVAESQRRFERRRRGIAEQYECRLRRKDGTEVWALVSTNPLYGPVDEFAGALGMISDITERKLAEEENRKLLADLAERVKELTALHGVARLLQREWSDTATLLGRFAELLPPAFRHAERTAARVRLGTVEAATPGFAPSPAALSADFTTADGQAGGVDVVYTAAPAHGDDGPFLAEEQALLVTSADMLRTAYDRWRAEAALRESEERFRQFAENVRQVFWMRTPDIGEILYVSPAYESVWGLTRESVFSSPRSFIEAIHAEDRDRVTRAMEDGRDGHEVEYRIVRPDGTQRWVWDRGFAVRDESGQVYRLAGIAEDITERKQAEERLRHQLDFTAAITASMGEGVYALNEDGRLTFINPAAEAALGWTEAELLGRQVHEVIHFQHADGAPRPAHDCPLLGVLTSGETCRGEDDVFTRRDGTLLPVSYTAAPILTGGRIIGTVLAFRDITERKRAEEERERLAAIVESSEDAIVSKDLDGRVTSWNPGAERMYGYPAAEAVGRHVSFIAPPNRHEQLSELMKRIARGERVTHLETVRVRKDGRHVEVSLSISPMKDGAGRVIGASAIARDITERKATERELRESEERYRDLVENARDIIYSQDLEGNYTSLNRAGEQLTGYTREEALRMNTARVVAPEYFEKARRMVARKLAGEEETVYDLEIITKDGRRVAIEVSSRLVFQDGVAISIQGIARDITERKHLEEQLRQSQKMEAIGMLAGGVAHDFNNLLTAILGNTQLAARRLAGEDPLHLRLDEIREAAERAAKLTRQLLAFSRRQHLERRPLNLNGTVSEIMKMVRRIIGADVEVMVKESPNLPPVYADPAQIEQVVMNLAVNARDAMPSGGTLALEMRAVMLDEAYCRLHPYARAGRYIELCVSDTGLGMDAATRERIFEPFFTTKAQGKGTGLGLAMVYGIVKQHDGHINVYSEPGHGTNFKVYLPIAAGEAEEGAAPEQVTLVGGTETILVAEDEEALRRLVKDVLEDLGYTVLLAKDGEEAVEMYAAARGQIDLLLLDVVMPRLGGQEAYERIRALGNGVPVFFMTGYSIDTVQNRFVKSDGLIAKYGPLIQKPYTVESLGRKVREVLDGERTQ